MLLKDVQAGFDGDPAAKSREDVVISYPGLFAIFVYRVRKKTKEVDYDTQGWHILAPNSLGIIFSVHFWFAVAFCTGR